MTCNSTCPLCRLEAVATRLERILTAHIAQSAGLNTHLAEDEGREAKKVGYENAVRKRKEAAMIVGSQRAAQAAAGVAVDAGSALDLNLDTVDELTALEAEERTQREAYERRVDAWNLRGQTETRE